MNLIAFMFNLTHYMTVTTGFNKLYIANFKINTFKQLMIVIKDFII